MEKLKKISIFFLLIVLTCGVVFVPQLISGQREDDLLNEIFYRNYNAGNRPKLTSEQVARLYYNREISIGYNSSPVSNENSDTETIRENVTDLAELIFGGDGIICDKVKSTLRDGSISYSRNSNLIKIDNQPTALNFIHFEAKSADVFFDILYEEKTKTIINLSCNILESEFENVNVADLFLGKVASTVNNYYEKQLNFNKDEYFFVVDFPDLVKNEENVYSASIYINCGLLQFDDKVLIEQDIP